MERGTCVNFAAIDGCCEVGVNIHATFGPNVGMAERMACRHEVRTLKWVDGKRDCGWYSFKHPGSTEIACEKRKMPESIALTIQQE